MQNEKEGRPEGCPFYYVGGHSGGHRRKFPKILENKNNKKYRKTLVLSGFTVLFGGDNRDRTGDLLNAIQALSQLSYTPIFGSLFQTAFVL